MASMKAMLRKIDVAGRSNTSLLDAALGLGVGVAVPRVAERVMGALPVPAIMGGENMRYWAAGIGAVASLGLAYLRGMGAATVAFVASVLYGVGPLLEEHVLTPVMSAVVGLIPAGGTSSNAGLLTARQLGLLTASQDTGRLVVQAAGQQAAVGSGSLGAFGTPSFGGGDGGY